MFIALLLVSMSFFFIDPPGDGTPAACRGDIQCSSIDTQSCSVTIPPDGYCIVDRAQYSLKCTAYFSDGTFAEKEETYCYGVVDGNFCYPSQPWWICTSEYI